MSGKRVMIFIVPCSCVWEAGEIKRAGPLQPLWPGYKSEQPHPGNSQSMLSVPDSQASSLLPFLTSMGGEEGTGAASAVPRALGALCRASVCREGNNQILKQGSGIKWDLHLGVTLLPGWDKQSQGILHCCFSDSFSQVEKPKVKITPAFLLGLE